MSENHFIFPLIHKETKKYCEISYDVSEWPMSFRCGDSLVPTQD